MPDFLAGQKLTALHFPPTVSDTEDNSFSFDSTTFGVDADSGTYNDCAVTFVACFTGRAIIHFAANLKNTSAAATNVSPQVREGAVIGSGTIVLDAALERCVRNIGTDDRRYGAPILLPGLTAGATYNCRLLHRVSGGTGTVQYRHLLVQPAT